MRNRTPPELRPRRSTPHRRTSLLRPRPAPPSDDQIAKLKELAQLKDQGILTEAEFNDQKAKILAQM